MPTGYTSFIEKGKVTTGKDFLLLCTRAYGVAINIRDEPLEVPTPIKFEPNEYYQRKYEESKQRLDKTIKMTIDEIRENLIIEHNDSIKYANKRISETKSKIDRYTSIRNQIVNWIPPSNEHESLKHFALQQIDLTLEEHKDTLEYYQNIISKPFDISDEAIDKYKKELIKEANDEVKRSALNLENEINRTKNNNIYMKELIDSLEKL